MAKSAKKKSVGLTPMREYPTFQGIYELHPQNDLTNDELYAKSILDVIEWLRGRIMERGGDPSFLDKYPKPKEYAEFDPMSIDDVNANVAYSIQTVNWPEESTWSLKVDELSFKKENQWFKTMVTLKKLEDSVALAAQTVCRETIVDELAQVFRLGFISHAFMYDKDILITELGLDTEWPLYPEVIKLNGKSNSEVEAFKKSLVDNPNRNFPIIVLTPDSYNRINDEEDVKDKFFDATKMVSYTVVLEGSTRKLFNEDSDKRCADILESDKGVVVINRAADNAAPKSYIIIDEENEIKNGDFNGMRFSIRNNTRNKEVDFSEIGLYSDILAKRFASRLPQGVDSAQSAELMEIINNLQEELDEKKQSEAASAKRIEDLEEEKKALDERNFNLYRENTQLHSLKMQLDDKHDENLTAEEKISLLEGRIAEMRDENAKIIERARPLLELQIPSSYPRERFLEWIRDYYGDALIIHERAEKEFLSDKKPRDFNMLARMFHYVYGYTICRNENIGDENRAKELAKAYDVLSENWEITKDGTAYEHHKKKYSLDISEYDKDAGTIKLLWHITNGKGMDADSIRIYTHYVEKLGKTIIGSMMIHLPMAGLPR